VVTTLAVRLAPPRGPLGITINDGARYTNDPDVTISAIWPALATKMLISNDGGFRKATTVAVNLETGWHLRIARSPDRLPQTVYVRFVGGRSGAETYQDDIVLDMISPKLLTVEAQPAAHEAGFRLSMHAKDSISGVAFAQFARSRAHPGRLVRYRHVMSVKHLPRLIRVRDRAGNFSRWRRVR
jgi:hypothetical protein